MIHGNVSFLDSKKSQLILILGCISIYIYIILIKWSNVNIFNHLRFVFFCCFSSIASIVKFIYLFLCKVLKGWTKWVFWVHSWNKPWVSWHVVTVEQFRFACWHISVCCSVAIALIIIDKIDIVKLFCMVFISRWNRS